MSWVGLAIAGNMAICVSYLMIAFLIGRGLSHERQWRRNPLATATCAIFFSCACGHAVHVEHLVAASGGAGLGPSDWHEAVFDLVTAGVAVWYLTLRSRFAVLLGETRMYDDLDERQRTALEVNDDVIQSLVTAKLALDIGEVDEARRVVEEALTASRQVVGKMLAPVVASGALRPGDLRRRNPAR